MIKAEMVYTLEDMKVFGRKALAFRRNIILNGIIMLCSVFMLLTYYILTLNSIKVSNQTYYILISVLGILYSIYNLVSIFILLPKKNYNRIKTTYGDNPAIYTFHDEYFNLKVENGVNSEDSSLEYKNLHCVLEIKDYFFIYFSKNQAYTLRKSAITEGTPEDLTVLLKKHLGDKFKSRF